MGRGKHCTPEERKHIQGLYRENVPIKTICKAFGRSRTFVDNAIRSEATGKSTGRPRKTTADVDARIVEMIRADPFKTCTRIKQELGLQVSAKTVSRRLHAAGFCARRPRKVRKLQPHHVEARIRFAEEHLAASIFWWSKIIFSDESRINLDGSDGIKYVWRFPNQAYHPKNTIKTLSHGGGHVMVWGCFSWHGTGPLFRINGTLNSEGYRKILSRKMLPYARQQFGDEEHYIFQHDNDSKHTSRTVKCYLANQDVQVLPWPALSPDLNPIENLWSTLKRQLKNQPARSADDLWTRCKFMWERIDRSECRNLIGDMAKRCQEVIANNGHQIDR